MSERLLESHQGHINDEGRPSRVDYVVFGSRVPGVFNLGGDLNTFIQAIMRKDDALLRRYADLCVDNIYRRAIGFGSDITTVALVQGKALGGGFECALACDVIVAEKSASFSFPEVLFNMFPGMGALSFLSRMIGLKKAEEIVNSGNVYTAAQMYELGVVDLLTEDGLGLEAVRKLIAQRQRRQNSYRALQVAKRFVQPVAHSELKAVVDVWVRAALRLDTRDLRMMARLVQAQNRMAAVSADDTYVERLYGAEKQAISA
jgi:DSF synthase